MTQLKFDVFISYRRAGGEVMGRLLFELLKNDYNVFFDHETLSTGRFDEKLFKVIIECNSVLVILSKGCLERCSNEGDWFMSEIDCAIENNKTIIPLMMEDFKMPKEEELLKYPTNIQKLLKYNGYTLSVAHLDSIISKLHRDMSTVKKEKKLVDSVSAWGEFARCLSDSKYTQLLPDELKERILRGSIHSFFDGWGEKIFNSILDRMIKQKYNVKTKFHYEIEIDNYFNFRELDIDADKYYKLTEFLSYSKEFLNETANGDFWISFATNLDELDDSLRKENFLFSENLIADKEDLNILEKLDDEEKKKFYLNTLNVRININGEVFNPIKVIINESGIFAKYELEGEDFKSVNTYNVKLRFSIPQKDGSGYFFASISEPTYSPLIRFIYPEDYYDVKMIPFLNRSVTASETKIFDGIRELYIDKEWVIPGSGAMFFINKK